MRNIHSLRTNYISIHLSGICLSVIYLSIIYNFNLLLSDIALLLKDASLHNSYSKSFCCDVKNCFIGSIYFIYSFLVLVNM